MRSNLPAIDQIWIEPPAVQFPQEWVSALSLPDPILRILYRQGIRTISQAHAFLYFQKYKPASPFDLPDMDKGIERIIKAIKSSEKIGIWGDFDVDGQTATAVLVSTLRKIGANVDYHIPIRGPESHGIQLKSLQNFTRNGISLIVTCDTGISEHTSIAWAQEHGIDVIVTDHHTLPSHLPNACAVINPQRLEQIHPLRPLPGVGTACKFAEALLGEYNDKLFSNSLHDLAALGIIADIVELRGDARYMTQSGLNLIRNSTRPSIKAMLDAVEISANQFSEEGIAYSLAPRMNAVGRLTDANPMVEFLLSEDPTLLSVTVNQLEGLNARRKLLCDSVFQGALSQIERTPSLLDHPVLMLSHPEWPAGVVGITASRLVALFHRPVLLFVSPPGELMRGSARSLDGIDITAAIRQQSSLLASFGGHPMAAGLALDPQNIKEFQRNIDQLIEKELSDHRLINELQIDGWRQPNSIDPDFLQAVEQLSPFGAGNSSLVFAAQGLHLHSTTPIGKTHEHLQMVVEDCNGQMSKLIWWQGADLPQPDGLFDLAYTARNSTYKGIPQIQLEWLGFRISKTETMTLHSAKVGLEYLDYRSSQNRDFLLKEATEYYQPEIYAEGSTSIPYKTKGRNDLVTNETLLIWSLPPNQKVLDEIIKRVNPKRIIWFANAPDENNPDIFINKAAKTIKDILDKEQPAINLSVLAANLASTIETVALTIRWLTARGDISVLRQTNNSILINPGGSLNEIEEKDLQSQVKRSLSEIQAFRRYYLQTDLENLINQP